MARKCKKYVSKINCKEGRHSIDVVVITTVIRYCTVVSRINVHPYAHHPFSLQVIAKGHLLLERTLTQQTKTTGSSMHNNEICSACVGLLYFVLHERDNKQTHSSSSSLNGCNWGTAAEVDAVGEQQLKWTQSGHSSV